MERRNQFHRRAAIVRASRGYRGGTNTSACGAKFAQEKKKNPFCPFVDFPIRGRWQRASSTCCSQRLVPFSADNEAPLQISRTPTRRDLLTLRYPHIVERTSAAAGCILHQPGLPCCNAKRQRSQEAAKSWKNSLRRIIPKQRYVSWYGAPRKELASGFCKRQGSYRPITCSHCPGRRSINQPPCGLSAMYRTSTVCTHRQAPHTGRGYDQYALGTRSTQARPPRSSASVAVSSRSGSDA